ncbi:hypothetical protein ABE042_15665 [Viridibacillus arvi]|uniref:hypothetical protein n=1 Tax=Viridibacillus arvi TaxID=263475 RepID=UPI003D29F613
MKKDAFVDLEKVRFEILKQKTQAGIDELNKNPRQQWASLRLERPLLDTLLRLIENED